MSQAEWPQEFFIKKGQYFLKVMNARWPRSEATVEAVTKLLAGHGIKTGKILDLCCGNGRLAIGLAKKGFEVVGIDLSLLYIEDASRRASQLGLESKARFFVGDARQVEETAGSEAPFDSVINFWTSIGYYDDKTDQLIFSKVRGLTKENGVLIVGECMHRERLQLRFVPTLYTEYEDMVVLETSEFDSLSSTVRSTWRYYTKEGPNLSFLDSASFRLRVYSLNEIASVLGRAGWRVLEAYGSIETLQPFSPLTSMNIVARAI